MPSRIKVDVEKVNELVSAFNSTKENKSDEINLNIVLDNETDSGLLIDEPVILMANMHFMFVLKVTDGYPMDNHYVSEKFIVIGDELTNPLFDYIQDVITLCWQVWDCVYFVEVKPEVRSSSKKGDTE